MKMKTLLSIIVICALAFATSAFAKSNKNDKNVTTSGSIVTITTSSITVSISQSNQQSWKISKHTIVKLNGVASTIDKLSAGMNASIISSSSKSKSAKEIDATPLPKTS